METVNADWIELGWVSVDTSALFEPLRGKKVSSFVALNMLSPGATHTPMSMSLSPESGARFKAFLAPAPEDFCGVPVDFTLRSSERGLSLTFYPKATQL